MQAAIARSHGKKVAAQIGHKFTTTTTTPDAGPVLLVDRRSMKDERTNPTSPRHRDECERAADGRHDRGGGGGGVPTPLLVLGGIAVVLVGSGAVGIVVRRRRA